MSHLHTVQGIYEAFGRGDIPAILATLAEGVEWEHGMADAGVPWLQPRTGRGAVAGFFQSLAALEFQRFEPTMLLENDDTVVALINVRFVVKDTGKAIVEDDEVHIWRFDTNGQVIRFNHKLDSFQHWSAMRP